MEKLKNREDMNSEFQWDLKDTYASDTEWEESYEKTLIRMNGFSKYKGNLSNNNGETLLEALIELSELFKNSLRLYVYANLKHYQDTQNQIYNDLQIRAHKIYTNVYTISSFADPEILEIGYEKVNIFIESNKGLALYKHDLENLFRKAQHTLSADREKILAEMSSFTNLPSKIYTIINNAEAKFKPAIDKHGNEVEVTHGQYSKIMEGEDRVLRESFHNSYLDYFCERKDSIAGLYSGLVNQNNFFAKTRNYSSSLEMHLYSNNIPTSVYENLITSVTENAQVLNRYTNIRKKALGVDVLKPYDLLASMVPDVDYKVTYEEAKEIIIKALAPMGEEYVNIVKTILNSKWIDVYENKNKRSGAFSWGTYGTPPYIMMSFKDDLYSLFTLAHELGHSVHSHYSRTTQPFVYSNYSIFIAEVASTAHEVLLMDYLLKTTTDKKLRKYLLNYKIKDFVSTFFRQTMFAEFELEAHRLEENKKIINSETLSDMYKGILEKYLGKDLELDDKIIYEWARIPHFYTSYYVYQYATDYAAAMAISKSIIENKEGAVNSFTELLKSGSSDYPIPLLKKAGVDMTTSKPIEDALSVFSDLLDEFEKE